MREWGAAMTRTNAREIAMRLTFELGYSSETAQALLDRELTPERFELLAGEDPLYGSFPNEKQKTYITELVQGTLAHGAELDGYIEKYAVGWRFSRIDRVAAAIMRVAMYEVLYRPDVPNRAAVNEAVEIAKRYLDADVVRFVNGILGAFVRAEFPEDGVDKPDQPREAASAPEEG